LHGKSIDLVDLAVVVIVLDKPRLDQHIEWQHKVLTVVAKVIVKRVNRATGDGTRKRSLRVPPTPKALPSQKRTFSII
jgi:hypothetical protein